jgi:multiple sugar transport system permease protein
MKSKLGARGGEMKAALAFLLPNFLGFLIFTAGPVLFSLVVSFSNWTLTKTEPFHWNGISNYLDLFGDKNFWLYFLNTGYLMLGMPIAIGGSLLLALLLSQKLRGMVVYRTLFYLPSFTNGVALLILWKALYNPNFGPVNAIIGPLCHAAAVVAHQVFHASAVLTAHFAPPDWLLSTKNLFGIDVEDVKINTAQIGIGARDAIIYMGIWIAVGGNNMLLYLAGVTNIPQELFEAAQIDGAGAWATFRHVTWPQLAPTTFFIVVMSFIGGLQGGFEQARVLTNGGPAMTTTTLSYYIYTKAFEEFQIGYASAISWVLFVVIAVVTLVNWKYGSRETTD